MNSYPSGPTPFISYCSGLSCGADGPSIGQWARIRCYSGMKQRRFFEARGEESGEWLVLDAKRHPPRVMCAACASWRWSWQPASGRGRIYTWTAPKNAALIVSALEAHNSELYAKFPLEGSGRLNEQSAVNPCLPSDEVESASTRKPPRKSRAGHRD